MPVNIAKLFCYVDESGQHTATNPDRSHIFVVATAIFDGALRDEAEQACLMYEHNSGKKKRKWSTCERENKLAFVRMIIDDDRFKRSLFVSVMRIVGQYDYDVRTILSIAKAVQMHQSTQDYTIDIYVDGISKTKQVEYARELRRLGIHVRRVHLARDESYALIRLADACASLAREAEEGHQEAAMLSRRGQRKGVIVVA